MELDAKSEKHLITEQDMVMEVKAMIKEFIVGTFSVSGQNISVILPNGQEFVIKVQSSV